MKRDMDLVRELLLKIEASNRPMSFSKLVPERKEGTAEYEFAGYHMKMLIEEVGFVSGKNASSYDGPEWINLQLTWHGQDFLDTVRDNAVWSQTKEGARKLGGASLEMLMDLAKAYAKMELKKRTGIDLG
jgi:hypothetical protein